MTFDEFRRTLDGSQPPPDLDGAMEAVWWAGKGSWDRAHERAQANEGEAASDLVHAHLHRREGDLGNAAYWYRRAGEPVATSSLDAEWEAIARRLLAGRQSPA